jgi:ribosomal protein L40E
MAFFEQLGKRITDAGQGVAHQAKSFADVTRINSELAGKERQIAQLYQTIGKLYYERHRDDPAPEFQEEVTAIKTLFSEIAQRKEEIKQIKGIEKCPNCGADVPFQAAFCNACGAKMPPAEPVAPSAKAENGQVCPACGAPMGNNNQFCTHCGTKLNGNENQEG